MISSQPASTPDARRRRRLRPHGETLVEPFPLGRRARAKLPFDRELRLGVAVALVAALTALGALVRLGSAPGLSVDELRTIGQTQLGFGGLIANLPRGVGPPLYPVLEWCAVHIFGGSSVALRLPALLAGIALLPATAALAREVFDRRTAVLAAMLAAIAPILVWYSQYAGGYELVALFGTLALLGAFRAARTQRPLDWALHALGAGAAVWAGWSGIFIVVASELVLGAALLHRRRTGAPVRGMAVAWALDTVALAWQLAALALLFALQLGHHGGVAGVATVGASGVSFYSTVSNLSWGVFGFQPGSVTTGLAAVWPLAMLASLVLIGRGVSRRGWLLLAGLLAPALGTLAIGLAVPGAFDVRYAVAAAPPALVLLARAARAWPPGPTGRTLLAVGLVCLLGGALADQQLGSGNPRRYDYRPAIAQVRRDASRGDAVLYEPSSMRLVLMRYAPRLRASPLRRTVPARAHARSVFVIASFESRPSVRALLNRDLGALHATRRLVARHRYPGVTVWWFR